MTTNTSNAETSSPLRLQPFGVGLATGAGGNLLLAKGVITTANKSFDAAAELNAG